MKKYFPALLYIFLISCKQNEIITPSNKPIIEESLAPSGIKSDSAFINNSKIKIQISWNQINTSAYKSIKLYKGINSGPISLTATLNTSEKKYVDSIDLKSNTTYNYKLSTINIKDVESPLTPEITVNTPKYIKFENGTGFNSRISVSQVTPEGNILFGGDFTTYNGQSARYLIQLNNDGSIDNTFNPASIINDRVNTISIQPDGKILVGGNNSIFYKLNKDGSVDNTFKTGLGFGAFGVSIPAHIWFVSTNKDGSIFVTGSFSSYNSIKVGSLIKLKSDGNIDVSFDEKKQFNGASGNSSNANLFLGNGTILAGAIGMNRYLNPVFLINNDGSVDNNSILVKNINSTFPGGRVTAITQQLDGKILISGYLNNLNGINNIYRFNSDGIIDKDFKIGTTDEPVTSIKIQNDGKIVIVGGFKKYNNTTQNHLLRLNIDGSIDNTFNSGNGFNYPENPTLPTYIPNFNILNNGKILITGDFIYYNNIKKAFIVLLNKDGSIADSMLH